MKKYFLPVSVIFLILSACESAIETPDQEVVFKIGQDLKFKYSDIQLYDSSTHILYFNEGHSEFDRVSQSQFTFFADGIEVYTGSFWPAFLNSMPSGTFISSPSLYPDFALRIEYRNNGNPDRRNDPQLIQSLKSRGIMHSGLSVLIDSLEINGTRLSFLFTVSNHDLSDLLIIDPDKTGPGLFHYFTNGLIIYNMNYSTVFSSNIVPEAPAPWDSWNIEWLSVIKSGESRQFMINYTINAPLDRGKYSAFFVYPGLEFQLKKEELVQDGGRIWLGNIQASKYITVQ
jgi:hypothetical protein